MTRQFNALLRQTATWNNLLTSLKNFDI